MCICTQCLPVTGNNLYPTCVHVGMAVQHWLDMLHTILACIHILQVLMCDFRILQNCSSCFCCMHHAYSGKEQCFNWVMDSSSNGGNELGECQTYSCLTWSHCQHTCDSLHQFVRVQWRTFSWLAIEEEAQKRQPMWLDYIEGAMWLRMPISLFIIMLCTNYIYWASYCTFLIATISVIMLQVWTSLYHILSRHLSDRKCILSQ